jgi:hypothetical protein
MDNVVTLGIDLAKNVFAVHGVDAASCGAAANGYSFEIIGTDSETAAVPDWYASVLRCARVGAAICAVWAQRQVDEPGVCHPVPQGRQERR